MKYTQICIIPRSPHHGKWATLVDGFTVSVGLEEFVDVFEKHKITGVGLLDITMGDLKDMGIELFPSHPQNESKPASKEPQVSTHMG